MNENLPTIIFTNYWTARNLINERKGGKAYSISLSNPKGFEELEKVKCFCPTWDILNRYKEDQDWNKYTKDFISMVKDNRMEIKEWIGRLSDGEYYLCCWENTKKGANCHRKILFELLSKSSIMNKKAVYKYLD